MKTMCDDLIGMSYEKMDCWALTREAAGRYGVALPAADEWSREDPRQILEGAELYRHEFEEVRDPRPGDIAAFRRMDGGLHFGAVVEGGFVLHTNEALGAHKISLAHPTFRRLIKGFFRCRS